MEISRRTFLKSSAAGLGATWKATKGFSDPTRASAVGASVSAASDMRQIAIARVEEMPNIPQPFKIRDWPQVARDYDAWAFDLKAKGRYMPLVWIDKSHINFDEDTFGLYVAVGDPRCGPKENGGQYHEVLNDIPAVYGATMVGIDKSNQNGFNWAGMCKAYFNRANGRNVVMEYTRYFDAWKIGGGYGIDFWQDVFPSMMFFQLAHFYPQEPKFDEIMRSCAEQFHRAAGILKKSSRQFGYSTFDWKTMKPVIDKICPKTGEPDAAGAFAWLEYMSYVKFGDPRYLETAHLTLQTLTAHNRNPRYEPMFIAYCACLAARMNAEAGRSYDTERLVHWTFADDSYVHPQAEVLAKRFGNDDVSGLFAWVRDRAYLMETCQLASALIPMVRYDPRFARAIAKWMLNAANNARFFYPGELPDADQAAPEYKALVENVCGYEALTIRNNAPYATYDNWKCYRPDDALYVFPKVSHFSLYGSSHIGILGGIISRTDNEKILQLDCLKTDYFHDKAYPTHLYFNPYGEDKEVHIDLGPKRVDLYDTVSKQWVKRGAQERTPLGLAKDSAAVIVRVPSGATVIQKGDKLLANGVVVDFRRCGPA